MRKPKNYYYDLSVEKLEKISTLETKPTLLLHSCCAPCNSYVMVMLSEYFDLTLLYNNSNIYPEKEYSIRAEELKAYTRDVNEKYGTSIKFVEPPYNSTEFHKELAKFHVAEERYTEGKERCIRCYTMRMEEAYEYAIDHNFDYFTTVMTISRQKNSIILNEIGESLNEKFKSDQYFFSDFKKKNGLLKSKAIIDEYDMYRQEYCGCAYSYHDYLDRKNNDKKQK